MTRKTKSKTKGPTQPQQVKPEHGLEKDVEAHVTLDHHRTISKDPHNITIMNALPSPKSTVYQDYLRDSMNYHQIQMLKRKRTEQSGANGTEQEQSSPLLTEKSIPIQSSLINTLFPLSATSRSETKSKREVLPQTINTTQRLTFLDTSLLDAEASSKKEKIPSLKGGNPGTGIFGMINSLAGGDDNETEKHSWMENFGMPSVRAIARFTRSERVLRRITIFIRRNWYWLRIFSFLGVGAFVVLVILPLIAI